MPCRLFWKQQHAGLLAGAALIISSLLLLPLKQWIDQLSLTKSLKPSSIFIVDVLKSCSPSTQELPAKSSCQTSVLTLAYSVPLAVLLQSKVWAWRMLHSWYYSGFSPGCNVDFSKYRFQTHRDVSDRQYGGSRYCMDMKEGQVGFISGMLHITAQSQPQEKCLQESSELKWSGDQEGQSETKNQEG